jgi:hypothetical protein
MRKVRAAGAARTNDEAGCCLSRQNRDNPHIPWIDDHNFILMDEVEEAAPRGIDLNEIAWYRRDMDVAARDRGADRDVKADVVNSRSAARPDDPAANPRPLLVVSVPLKPDALPCRPFRPRFCTIAAAARLRCSPCKARSPRSALFVRLTSSAR